MLGGADVGPSNPLGTYNNPIEDEPGGDLSVPCIAGCIAQLAHGTTNGCGLGTQPSD